MKRGRMWAIFGMAASVVCCSLVMTARPLSIFADEADTEPPVGHYPSYTDGTVPISDHYGLGVVLKDNVGVTDVHVYLDDVLLASGDKGVTWSLSQWPSEMLASVQWDTTQVPNGIHKFQMQVEDATGNTSWATTPEGQDHINYQTAFYKPPVSAPAPTEQIDTQVSANATEPSTCSTSQEEVTAVTKRIIARAKNRLFYMNDTLRQVEKFYVDSGKTVTAYDQTISDAYNAHAQAEVAITTLSNAAITCNAHPQEDLAAFKAALRDAKSALAVYRQAEQKVIAILHEN